MLQEFKKFILRGNVLDLAVAVIIGGAFGKIVASLVEDVIMPPIGLLLGKVDFSNLYINLSGGSYETLAKAREAGAVTINYGLFLNAVINFLIVGFVIFIAVKAANRVQKIVPKEETPKTTQNCPYCDSVISLKAKRCPNCTSNLP